MKGEEVSWFVRWNLDGLSPELPLANKWECTPAQCRSRMAALWSLRWPWKVTLVLSTADTSSCRQRGKWVSGMGVSTRWAWTWTLSLQNTQSLWSVMLAVLPVCGGGCAATSSHCSPSQVHARSMPASQKSQLELRPPKVWRFVKLNLTNLAALDVDFSQFDQSITFLLFY